MNNSISQTPFAIAIAGHSGAGKSTLMKHLAMRLGSAITLGIDDYNSDAPRAVQWIADGADPNEFKTPQFFEDVRALKEGKAIIHPETKQEVKPTEYLIIEEPFGRGRSALRELIDFLVYLDTPLEVAYIRKLSRKSDFLPWEDNPSVFIEHLRENMEWYLRVGRNFYLAVSKSAVKDCDLIVDGLRTTDELVTEIYSAVKR
jgi:uridine kinase